MTASILIVDDSRTHRAHLRGLLEGVGFEVEEAVDGIRGCQKVHNERFDCVICDVNMPYMDGIKFVALIKVHAQNESLPVLMLTSEKSPQAMRRGRDAGASLWMTKPFQPQQLIQVVKGMLLQQKERDEK